MQVQQSNNKSSLVGIVVVAGIVLFIVMGAVGPGSWLMKKWNETPGQSSQAPASGPSIVGGPSLSAQQVDTILTNAGSPAAGTGQDLYNLSQQYGVDDAFALAVFKHESGYGKNGEATITRSLGNLRPVPSEAFERDGYAVFYTWQDGYAAFYKLISGPLYVGAGLTTPSAIMPRYAPSEDNNNPQEYASDVEQDMQTWRAA